MLFNLNFFILSDKNLILRDYRSVDVSEDGTNSTAEKQCVVVERLVMSMGHAGVVNAKIDQLASVLHFDTSAANASVLNDALERTIGELSPH